MKSLMPKIDSNDGLFHNGNPATGEQGTRVTDTWLNDVQDRVRDVQAEAHYVLQKAGFQPVENKQTQLYEAIVKIIDDNRKTASLTQKGETQLYTGYDSQSEDLALTPKTAYQLKQLIDSNTRSLANVIPNSKKSSAVNSNSEDTVATSAAVKSAYDKGVEAKTAADNANNNANGRVSKNGDVINGTLFIDGAVSGGFANGLSIRNKAGGKFTSGFIDFFQSDNVPRSSIWFRDVGNNSTQIEFLNTPEGADGAKDSRQGAFTISSAGNLWSRKYGWLHDYFAKQDDINNAWTNINNARTDINNAWAELNNNVVKRGDFIRNWYPNHYNGTEVYKIRHLNLMITVMYATGDKELILPEHYDGHFGVWATDRGTGNITVNSNYPVGNNRVRVGGRGDTAVTVLVIGMKSV